MSNKKTNKIKKPIVVEKEEFIEEESSKTAIILLGLGILLVIGLIIGTIIYLNNDAKKIEKNKETEKEKTEEIETEEESEETQEKEIIDDVVIAVPTGEKTVEKVVYTPTVTKYTVEYYSNDELIKTESVKSGANIAEPSLTLNNQRFLYWYYLDVNNTEVVFDFSADTVQSNLKLYAKLINIYTVDFLDNTDTKITDSQILDSGELIEEIEAEDLVKDFGNNVYRKIYNWYTDKNFTILFDLNTPITENLILYGKYEDVYKVTFYLESLNNYSDYDGEKVEKFVKTNEKPEFLKYFNGSMHVKFWCEYNIVGNVYYFESYDFNELLNQNKILVPVYGYKLTYDTDGGNEIEDVIIDSSIPHLVEPATPVKPGYKFDKWIYEDESEVDFTTYNMEDNITITALWNAAVTFETNGGTPIDAIIPPESGNIIVPETTKEGYTFDGWYYDENFTDVVNLLTDEIVVPEVLYAKWIAKTNVITYDVNGGVNNEDLGNNKTQSDKTDETITLFDGSTYTKTNAELDGWSKTSDGEVEYELGEEITMPKTDTTIFAKWTNLYTLTIDLNSDDVTNPLNTSLELSKREQEALGTISLEGIIRENYRIKELNTASDGTGTTVTTETLMGNSNMTIYIIWEQEILDK